MLPSELTPGNRIVSRLDDDAGPNSIRKRTSKRRGVA